MLGEWTDYAPEDFVKPLSEIPRDASAAPQMMSY